MSIFNKTIQEITVKDLIKIWVVYSFVVGLDKAAAKSFRKYRESIKENNVEL